MAIDKKKIAEYEKVKLSFEQQWWMCETLDNGNEKTSVFPPQNRTRVVICCQPQLVMGKGQLQVSENLQFCV